MIYLVVFPIVSSGAALIFAASLAPTSLLPPLAAGGLGLLGIGKLSSLYVLLHLNFQGLASQMMCLGPLNCVTPGGQCCALITLRNRVMCPRFC